MEDKNSLNATRSWIQVSGRPHNVSSTSSTNDDKNKNLKKWTRKNEKKIIGSTSSFESSTL